MRCPECQTELPDAAKFCLECGHSLAEVPSAAEPRPTLEAERKRVTALFSDISGYTAMTAKLDPEEVKEITSRVFDGVREVVGKYEGFIERFAGDGVLALFGVPKAHEDDPIRAIHAAREIHELVESLSPQYQSKIGGSLSMHSGVNTGLAVTADVDMEKGTHGVTGDVINVTARLSDLAEAREILVGPDTYRACQGHFSFQPLTPTKVKGKTEPIPIFKVLSVKAADSHFRVGRQVASEMVGRDGELDKLEQQVMNAVNGRGSVVNVIGEAGIGKSRLIAELKRREVVNRVTLLEGRAIAIGKNLSFHPVIDLLKQWARIAEDDSESEAFSKLEKAVRVVCPEETDEILPFVATLMGMKLKGNHAERVKGIEGEGLEKLILKNVRELVIQWSGLKPTVLVLEDLHWADTSSLELLESLHRLAEKRRICFITVLRPGYCVSDGGRVAKTEKRLPDYCVEIQLQPLGKNDSEALIDNMLEIKGLPYSLKTQIVERAGGNPYFLEEVVRSLIDEGAVVMKDGRFEVTDKIDSVVIPPTINDVLVARIDRLEEKTRELVKVASVIGRSFFDRIIKDVASSIEDMDARLAYLKDVQIIRDRTRMSELEYLFKHALAQEAAYESTLLQQRKTLHLKVAQSIENVFQDRLQEFFGMLAYHYGKGENLEKAQEFLTKAGEEALRSSASSEALHYYKEALKIYLNEYGHAADPEKLAGYEKNIGIALHNKAQWMEAVKYLDRVLERWGAPLPRTKAAATVGLIRDLLVMIKVLYFRSPRSGKIPGDRENEIFELNFRVATALTFVDNARQFLASVAMIKRTTEFDMSEIRNVSTYWAGLSGLFSAAGLSFRLSNKIMEFSERFRVAGDIGGRINNACFSTINDTCQGAWSRINDLDEDLLSSSLTIGDFWYTLAYLWFYGLARGEQGKFPDVMKAIGILFNIGETYDNSAATVYARLLKAHFLVKTLDTHEAVTETEQGIAYSREKSTGLDEMIFMGFKAEAQTMQRDWEGAEESLSQAKEIHEKHRPVLPIFGAPYLVAHFLFDVHQLEQAIHSDVSSNVAHIRSRAYQAGKAALRNSRKFAPYRIKILRLMGDYYWIIGKQGKAMKWWDKAIKEGERLGARPDLSRTYFEVGKRMLEPQSKYKQLNGIDANGYLEKAGILFEEMGLERDLEDLERLRMGS